MYPYWTPWYMSWNVPALSPPVPHPAEGIGLVSGGGDEEDEVLWDDPHEATSIDDEHAIHDATRTFMRAPYHGGGEPSLCPPLKVGGLVRRQSVEHIAGSLALLRRVSTCPASWRSKVGSDGARRVKSYHPNDPSSVQRQAIVSPGPSSCSVVAFV